MPARAGRRMAAMPTSWWPTSRRLVSARSSGSLPPTPPQAPTTNPAITNGSVSGAGLHTEGQREPSALNAQHNPDLIVIGSGLGGLCCGALAARHNWDVLVEEARSWKAAALPA